MTRHFRTPAPAELAGAAAMRSNEQLASSETAHRLALRRSAEDLLRAQLKAGQHVLELKSARVMAMGLGLATILVRPGIGDPSAFKLREAR